MRKETIKIVYNDDYACPSMPLSQTAVEWMKVHGYSGKFADSSGRFCVPRHHPLLVECVEALGSAANRKEKKHGFMADLRIAEIEGDSYYVMDYDGKETVIGEKNLIPAKGKHPAFVDKFDADKVFFTADTHFGDPTLINLCGRPFKDAEEMDWELIRRWNETVPDDGVVFHLGDFAKGNASRWNEILQELHGTIHLILGNHDIVMKKEQAFVHFASVRDQRLIEIDGQKIYLNHYPFLCYSGSYSDVWQLFGHVHSAEGGLNSGLDYPRLKRLFPRQYDVGVDNNDYRPVSFADVRRRINAQVEQSRNQQIDSSSQFLSGTPVVFLDVDGVLSTSPFSREFSTAVKENLDELLRESGAGLVITGGWAAFKIDDLRNGPLKDFSGSLVGTTPQAPSHLESVAAWLSSTGGKHRYVILSTTPTDDTRFVRVDPSYGLSRENVHDALNLLKATTISVQCPSKR